MKEFYQLRKELKEDERKDTHFRTEARAAFSLLQGYLQKYVVNWGKERIERTFQILDPGATMVAPATLIGLPAKYSELLIAFGSKTAAPFGNSMLGTNSTPFFTIMRGRDEKEFPVIFLPIFTGDNIDINELGDISGQVEASFIHEFIHYLDFKRFFSTASTFSRKFDPNDVKNVQAKSFQDMYDYMNSPHEFNAYYQALVDKIENSEARDTFDWSTFSRFMDDISWNLPKIMKDYMNDEYKRKLVKRLYSFWVEKIEPFQDK